MLNEDPGGISFSEIGGLSEQIRELREVIELPLTNPELFIRVGIKPPKVSSGCGLWFSRFSRVFLSRPFPLMPTLPLVGGFTGVRIDGFVRHIREALRQLYPSRHV